MTRTFAALALLGLLALTAHILLPPVDQAIQEVIAHGNGLATAGPSAGPMAGVGEPRELSAPEPDAQARRSAVKPGIVLNGKIAGLALDESGNPLRETFLEAVPVADGDPRVGTVGRSRTSRSWWSPRTLTDDRGRFEFPDLQGGPYRIFLARRWWGGGPRQLTVKPLPVGASGLRLQLHGHRLAVRVHDGAGRPFPLVSGLLGPKFDRSVALRCEEIDPEGESKRLFPSKVEHGVAWYDVQPGHSYRVGSGDPANAPETFRIEAAARITRVDLLLPETVSTGSLALTLRDPDGRLYEFDNQVVVRRVKDGAVAVRSRMHDGPWFRCGLPPGEYRVRVTAEDTVPSCGNGFHPTPADFGPVQASFEVRLGEETQLNLSLARGGRILLALDLSGPPPTGVHAAALERYRDASNCNASYDALEQGNLGVSINLVPHTAGEPIALRFFIPGCMIIYDRPQALPGMASLTETLIPPGTYTLLLEDDDWWAAPTTVTVEEGRESAAQLRLHYTGR